MHQTPPPRSSSAVAKTKAKAPSKGLNFSPSPRELALMEMLEGFVKFALKDKNPEQRKAARNVERRLKEAFKKAA